MKEEENNTPTAKIETTQRINNITAKLAIGSEAMTKRSNIREYLSPTLDIDEQMKHNHLKTIIFMDKKYIYYLFCPTIK